MVQVLLEPQTKLNDSLTYDITAWSLPYAYGLKAIATKEEVETEAIKINTETNSVLSEKMYGYALSYGSFNDAKFIAALLKQGIGIRYTSLPISNSGKNWNPGSIFILKGDNLNHENYLKKIASLAKDFNRKLHPITTGYSTSGPDLGANELHLIKAPKIAILRSDDASTLSYGEVWHYFEQQLAYPLMQIDENKLGSALSEIDQLIIPNGYYEKWKTNNTNDKIIEWIRRGGKIIAISTIDSDVLKKIADDYIYISNCSDIQNGLTPLLTSIPLQLLAYHIAVLKGCNVDQPRNLAKSVTVE